MSATAPVLPMLNTNKNLEKGLTAEERLAAERQALRRRLQAARNNNVAGGRRGRTQRKKRTHRLASRKAHRKH
jgi:hypothetical protein